MTSYDATIFDYTTSGPVLTMYMDRSTAKEISDAKTGKLRIGYYVRGCVLFLVFMLGNTWMDAPFSIRRRDGRGETFDFSEEILADQGLMMQLYLVDRADATVKAIRMIGSSHSFAVGLRSEILKQLEQPFNDAAYNQTIDEVYNSLSSDDLAKRADNIFVVR